MAVANQWLIDIYTPKVKDGEKFLMIKTADLVEAMKRLNPSELKLYVYLANIKDGYRGWELSSKAVTKMFSFSDKTYDRARDGLVNKGYLV
jgi:hypothetical protein